MIEIKADGQAELRLLELLYPASPATPTQSGIALVTAETQQRIADLTYLVQTQQVQLEQAVTALNDYQQTVAALTGFSPHSQPLLPPASPSSNDSNRAASSSRRYITGGLGQSDGQRDGQSDGAITVGAQTAQTDLMRPATYSRWRRWRCQYFWPVGLPNRLTKTGLILVLSALTSWSVFKYIAPSIGSRLFPEPTVETLEPQPETVPEKVLEPRSNLTEDPTPGSAANKAGTSPPIPTAPAPALAQ